MTTPEPMALPAMFVPAPRAVTGTPSARQTSTMALTSSALRGKATQRGTTRWLDASEAYAERVPVSSAAVPEIFTVNIAVNAGSAGGMLDVRTAGPVTTDTLEGRR